MTYRDKIGITVLLVLITLHSMGDDIRVTLANTPMMFGVSATLAVWIPRFINREAAKSRTWRRVTSQALLGGLAGIGISLLYHLL